MTYLEVEKKYGRTHNIKLVKTAKIDLKNKDPKDIACWGDGKTYHWVVSPKEVKLELF